MTSPANQQHEPRPTRRHVPDQRVGRGSLARATLASAALLAALASCGDGDVLPPPYDVWPCESMPASDARHWQAAVASWNTAVGRDVLVWRSSQRVDRVGISVCTVSRLDSTDESLLCTEYGIGDGSVIEALPGAAHLCAAHELAHALGVQWHTEHGLMSAAWETSVIDDYAVHAVRRVWGW